MWEMLNQNLDKLRLYSPSESAVDDHGPGIKLTSMDDTDSQGITEEEPSSHDRGSVGSDKAEDDFESQALEDSKSTTKVRKCPRKTATDSRLSQRRRGEQRRGRHGRRRSGDVHRRRQVTNTLEIADSPDGLTIKQKTYRML